jgi:hypothetical protein
MEVVGHTLINPTLSVHTVYCSWYLLNQNENHWFSKKRMKCFVLVLCLWKNKKTSSNGTLCSYCHIYIWELLVEINDNYLKWASKPNSTWLCLKNISITIRQRDECLAECNEMMTKQTKWFFAFFLSFSFIYLLSVIYLFSYLSSIYLSWLW